MAIEYILSGSSLMHREKVSLACITCHLNINESTVRWAGKKLQPVGFKHKRKSYEVHKTCNRSAEQRKGKLCRIMQLCR